jgi:hypothetical protein
MRSVDAAAPLAARVRRNASRIADEVIAHLLSQYAS